MVTVVGVRFKKAGKIYYFAPGEISIQTGDDVIVETAREMELGNAVIGPKDVEDDKIVPPLKGVIRKATDDDREKYLDNKTRQKETLILSNEKIKKHKLVMKLIDAEYTFDNNKIIFYFKAGRKDI